jgi:hemolysin III
MIFVFIAASYTPVAILVLEDGVRWIVLAIVWVGAALGVAFSVAWVNAPRAVCAALYVGLGWVAVICLPQLISALPLIPLLLIATGGLLYTAGAVIFALGRPNPWPRTFGFHEIFHVFVILAAVAHFVAMAGWVVA